MTIDVQPDTTAPAALPGAAEAARLRRSYRRRHVLARIGLYVGAILAAFLCAAPFLWSLISAF
jgi:multiple sugar transport system permease protein